MKTIYTYIVAIIIIFAFTSCIQNKKQQPALDAQPEQVTSSQALPSSSSIELDHSSDEEPIEPDMTEIFFDGARYVRLDDETYETDEFDKEYFEQEYKEYGSVSGILLYQKIPVGDQPGGGISTIYYFSDGFRYSLYPVGELHIFGRELNETELQYAEDVKKLAKALESGDYEMIAYLAQSDEYKEVYASLADTDLEVREIIYHIYRNPYGITYEAYLDVDVKNSKVFPLGRHRLKVGFGRDYRIEYPREGLVLSVLSVMDANQCPYPQTDPDNTGWVAATEMITYRMDMPFESPADIPPELLLRIIVPTAYGDAVKSGTQNPVLTPERIAETAKIYFGLENFNPKSPDYYDAQTGNYTLKNHFKITAHMGSSMDYRDTEFIYDFSYGDNGGYRYVTIVHYKEPLCLIVDRIMEYKTVKFINEATGETAVRIISATEIISNE